MEYISQNVAICSLWTVCPCYFILDPLWLAITWLISISQPPKPKPSLWVQFPAESTWIIDDILLCCSQRCELNSNSNCLHPDTILEYNTGFGSDLTWNLSPIFSLGINIPKLLGRKKNTWNTITLYLLSSIQC